jgi:hypothetical protein
LSLLDPNLEPVIQLTFPPLSLRRVKNTGPSKPVTSYEEATLAEA